MTNTVALLNHVGILVDDLDRAIGRFSEALNLSFQDPATIEVPVREAHEVSRVLLRFTYSLEGPPYVELIEKVGAGVFGGPCEGLHHVGFWNPDLAARSLELSQADVSIEAEVIDAAGSAQTLFTQPENLCGIRLEILDEVLRPGTEHWLRTGTFLPGE